MFRQLTTAIAIIVSGVGAFRQFKTSTVITEPLTQEKYATLIPDIYPDGALRMSADLVVLHIEEESLPLSLKHTLVRSGYGPPQSSWLLSGLESWVMETKVGAVIWQPLVGDAIIVGESNPRISLQKNADGITITDGRYSWVYRDGRLRELVRDGHVALRFEGTSARISRIADGSGDVLLRAKWDDDGRIQFIGAGQYYATFRWENAMLCECNSSGNYMEFRYDNGLLVEWSANRTPVGACQWSAPQHSALPRLDNLPRITRGMSGTRYIYSNTPDGHTIQAIGEHAEVDARYSALSESFVLYHGGVRYISDIRIKR